MGITLERAKDKIRDYLVADRGGAFREADLASMLAHHKAEWGIRGRPSSRAFLAFLVEQVGLREVELRSDQGQYRPLTRFAFGDFSPYRMALTIRPRSYLSHGTAVFLHGLNDQLPKTLYVNQEQSEKPRQSGELSQDRITQAFSRHQRTSSYVYVFNSYRAVLLSGKQTGNLGVIQAKGPRGEDVTITNLARTLIDIVVRPAYAGGIFQVLEAYKGARDRVAGVDIVAMLKGLEYLYPYHQAVGFLMERAGYPESDWEQLRQLGTKFDFYLLHAIKRPRLDEKWRLFVPQGI
jgi:hypothetical protein